MRVEKLIVRVKIKVVKKLVVKKTEIIIPKA